MDDDAGPSNIKDEKFEDDVIEDADEPQEELQFNKGDDGGIVWLAKIPKSLMEAWSNVQEAGVHLASIRVYDQPKEGQTSPNISLILPQSPQYNQGMEPAAAEYEVQMLNEKVDSHYIVTDKEKPRQTNKRLRMTALAGRVHHKITLRPAMSAAYEAKIKKRSDEANRPKAQIKKLYDSKKDVDVGSTNFKMIQSGAAQSSAGFGSLGKNKKPAQKGEFERAARISRDELLDQLFALFTAEKPYWSMKDLRAKTVQPEAYLKEVLTDIGVFHKSGSNVNHWSLQAEYVAGTSAGMDTDGAGPSGVQQEGGMDEDDDDDDDEDMEQVS